MRSIRSIASLTTPPKRYSMRIDFARRLRTAAALIVLSALVGSSTMSAFAQTVTGTISGFVTSSQENMKLAGVTITAVAPSARYNAKTDQSGFFSINGVTPDTYTLTFAADGYEGFRLEGVTVVQGQIANASSVLNKSLVKIGRTGSRSTSGAFQPTQTTDQYNVGTQQISTVLGKSGGANEAALLASIPGASFDVNGFPVLRGGRETEEGFQFEGIDFTDAFTHQFVNSLILNGASNFQVTPGAGDASIGNVGTGAINIVAKRGTRPAFGQLEGDLRAGRYEHELRGEYGWASANGRFSEYASVFLDRNAYNYGGNGANPLLIGAYFTGRTSDSANDVVNNFVYKFGRDNSQSLQVFYDNTQFDLHFGYGTPATGLPFKDNDAQWLANGQANLGIASPFIQALLPFTYGQNSLTQRIGVGNERKVINGNQPNETFKLQYSNSLDSSTFLTTKFYRVNAVALFDSPYNGNGVVNGDFAGLQGGQRTGIALDGTRQLGSQHLLGFGGKFEYLTPIFSSPSSTNAAFTYGGFGNSIETADFLPALQPRKVAVDDAVPVVRAVEQRDGVDPVELRGEERRGVQAVRVLQLERLVRLVAVDDFALVPHADALGEAVLAVREREQRLNERRGDSQVGLSVRQPLRVVVLERQPGRGCPVSEVQIELGVVVEDLERLAVVAPELVDEVVDDVVRRVRRAAGEVRADQQRVRPVAAVVVRVAVEEDRRVLGEAPVRARPAVLAAQLVLVAARPQVAFQLSEGGTRPALRDDVDRAGSDVADRRVARTRRHLEVRGAVEDQRVHELMREGVGEVDPLELEALFGFAPAAQHGEPVHVERRARDRRQQRRFVGAAGLAEHGRDLLGADVVLVGRLRRLERAGRAA